MRRHRTTARGAFFLCLVAGLLAGTATAQSTGATKPIVFPVLGTARYVDDFGDARPGGLHQGIDIVAPKKSLALAAEAGKVKFWTTSATAGCMLYLYGASGTTYYYIHLNNDLTRGDDNRGKCVAGTAYAPGLKNGAKVTAGQPGGLVGDSGGAEGAHAHLHLEVHPGGGNAVDGEPEERAWRRPRARRGARPAQALLTRCDVTDVRAVCVHHEQPVVVAERDPAAVRRPTGRERRLSPQVTELSRPEVEQRDSGVRARIVELRVLDQQDLAAVGRPVRRVDGVSDNELLPSAAVLADDRQVRRDEVRVGGGADTERELLPARRPCRRAERLVVARQRDRRLRRPVGPHHVDGGVKLGSAVRVGDSTAAGREVRLRATVPRETPLALSIGSDLVEVGVILEGDPLPVRRPRQAGLAEAARRVSQLV